MIKDQLLKLEKLGYRLLDENNCISLIATKDENKEILKENDSEIMVNLYAFKDFFMGYNFPTYYKEINDELRQIKCKNNLTKERLEKLNNEYIIEFLDREENMYLYFDNATLEKNYCITYNQIKEINICGYEYEKEYNFDKEMDIMRTYHNYGSTRLNKQKNMKQQILNIIGEDINILNEELINCKELYHKEMERSLKEKIARERKLLLGENLSCIKNSLYDMSNQTKEELKKNMEEVLEDIITILEG